MKTALESQGGRLVIHMGFNQYIQLVLLETTTFDLDSSYEVFTHCWVMFTQMTQVLRQLRYFHYENLHMP